MKRDASEGVKRPAKLEIVAKWQVRVSVRTGAGKVISRTVALRPPAPENVRHEAYEKLPEFNAANAWGWLKGVPLTGVRAQECSTTGALVPASLRVASAAGAGATVYKRGRDYQADLPWGSIGRLPGGRIGPDQKVYVSYAYYPPRLDSIVLDAAGRIAVRVGTPHIAVPRPPKLAAGETRLANVFLEGPVPRLDRKHLYPVLETAYPEPPAERPSAAERLLPKTMKRLAAGGRLKILAWGDSVTDGGFLANVDRDRWQCQFAKRLRARFPKARIELVTEAWGGRNTTIYLAEPPGSLHNYREKVLAAKPDLVVMEFVNDAHLHGKALNAQYGRLLRDIRGMGAEWLILTPHYIRPDWMGLDRQKDIDEDPRSYVKSLRAFAAKNGVALADASLRYGRLWRQGIPYNTLMQNNINHPDARGMKLFADALMALFP